MLKNLAYILPLVGRVSMGELVKDDASKKAHPVKHSYFSITTQAKSNGKWIQHPVENRLLDAKSDDANAKLREIPIKVLFDNPDLSISENYVAFDDKGRQLCRGDASTAQQVTADGGLETIQCHGAEHCKQSCAARCSMLGRFHFSIDDPAKEGPTFEAFALRTSGFNSIRAIRAKLTLFAAAFGGLQGLPLKLVIRGKSSKASYNSVFFYADVDLNCDFLEAAEKVAAFKKDAAERGIKLDAMEAAYASLSGGFIQEAPDDTAEFEDISVGQFSVGNGWPSGEDESTSPPHNDSVLNNINTLVRHANSQQAVPTISAIQ